MAYSHDRVTIGGRVAVVMKPRIPRPGPPVVFLHSGAANGFEMLGAVHPSILKKIAAIVADPRDGGLGLTVIAPTQPIASFGNGAAADTGGTTAQGVLTDTIAYHRSNLLGTGDPVVLLGVSMGTQTALRRCGLAPSQVACFVGFLTVADLTVVYANNATFGLTALIGTAYGVTHPTPLPASTCPVHQLSDSVPKLITYGSADTFSTFTGHVTATEMASGRGAEFVVVPGASHTDAAVSGVDTEQVVEFIRSHTEE